MYADVDFEALLEDLTPLEETDTEGFNANDATIHEEGWSSVDTFQASIVHVDGRGTPFGQKSEVGDFLFGVGVVFGRWKV